MKKILLLLVLAGCVWAAGIRIYPEVFKDYAELFIHKDYRRIELRSGQSVIGEFESETKEGVKLKTRKGSIIFPATSIQKMNQLVLKDVFDALQRGNLPDTPKYPVAEYRASENLFLPWVHRLLKTLKR